MKIFICIALVFAVIGNTVLHAEPAEYIAYKTVSAMAMDGVLNEPAWQKATSVGPFVFAWHTSGVKEQTEAKIVWDNERLYFSFACDDKHIWAEHLTHFSAVYRDDCCEAFISPVPEGAERLDYINYEINCIGSFLAGYHAKSRGKDQRFEDCYGLEIGRVINGTVNDDSDIDNGWVLEFSVPFEHFSEFDAEYPPKDGQIIYLNLNRLGGMTNIQHSQWTASKTDKPNFHRPQDFGKVIFSTRELK
ncbi:carbohydrate-binding family 9-like protein [Candidatus Omnitrophota bacterium]